MKTAILIMLLLFQGHDGRGESPDELCDSPRTPDIVECIQRQLREAEQTQLAYLAEIRRRLEDHESDLAALEDAQRAWTDFVSADCRAVYERWKDGTIRGPMFVGCKLEHTVRRTHDLWERYLRGIVTELPEPFRPR